MTATGHTSYYSDVPVAPNEVNYDLNAVLYNAITYKKGVRSSIVLPVAPDPSAGKYFRLDRLEENAIIFEREYCPQANVPYVFIPNRDLRIELRDMDLSQQVIPVILGDLYFVGGYATSVGEQPISLLKAEMDAIQGDSLVGDWWGADTRPMHVTLAMMLGFYLKYNCWELIFHEDEVPYRPFIEKGKVWKVGLTNPNNNETLLNAYYYFDGDTIIDDRLCKKMMYRYEPGEEIKDDYADEVLYAGAYYEKDKLVCIAKKDWTSLGLLYDFTLNKGDEFEWNPDCSFVVKEMQMGGMEGFKGRNWTIRVTSLENEYWLDNIWMEGVGSMYTPDFDFLLPNWLMSTMTLMQCTVGDEVIYYDPDIIDGVNPPDDETKKRIDFTHVPKPRPKAPQNEAEADGDQLSGEYTLRLLDLNLGNMSDTYDVTITDDAGEVVYQKTVRTADVLALNIDISEWAAPSYTINVENDYEQYIGTFELTPTSIEEKYQEQSTKNNDVYDLQGRRVTTPTKGLYIINGKKVLIR